MQAKGYEIKDAEISENAHKYIGFRAPGQERWIRGRAKSLGPEYTKERIHERIEEKAKVRTEQMQRMYRRSGRMIDTSEEKFSDSPWLKRWADKQNLKEAARVQSLLAEKGLQSFKELDEKIEALHLQAKTGKKTTVSLDKELKQAGEILRYARQYAEKKKYEAAYDKSKDPERYYRAHHNDIRLAIGAREVLNSYGINASAINLPGLEADFVRLTADRERSLSSYKNAEKECENLKKLKDELTTYLGTEQKKEIEQNQQQTR